MKQAATILTRTDPFSNSNPLNPFGSTGRKVALAPFTTGYASVQFGYKQGNSLLRDNTWLQPIAEIAACYYGGPLACGAASGYLTRLNGGSFQQALTAGVLSYAFAEIGPVDTGNWATDALAAGAIGGADSSLTGGTFWRGFEFAAAGSLALSAYSDITNGAVPDYGPGEDQSLAIPCGQAASSCYTEGGNVPEDYWDKNLFGFNIQDGNCFDQSAPCSNLFDKVPGLNAVALLHDNWMISISGSTFANFATMLPAAALTYSAFVGEYYVPLLNIRTH
jgi:hypothetical protein